jgi:hypothetical protein
VAAHAARLNMADPFVDHDRRELHRLLAAAFADAAALVGATTATFRVGREHIRVRTAGDALALPLTRAMRHIRVDPMTPATATIDAWDSASTGRPLPVLADHLLRLLDKTWLEDRDVRGELRAFCDGPIRAAYYGPQLLSVYDVERRAGIYWLRDADALPWYEPGAPFRVLVDWIVANPTCQLLHAGAIADPAAAVILGGAGGSGKSTAALACLGHPELKYMSDDYVIVDVTSDPIITSVYSTGKLRSLSEFDRFEQLRGLVVNRDRAARNDDARPDSEKPMLYVHEFAPDRLAREMPVRALVFPQYLGLDDCVIEPLSSDIAFKLLAPSTIQQIPATGGVALRCIRTLASRVPAFVLGLPTDPSKVPDGLVAILAGVQ